MHQVLFYCLMDARGSSRTKRDRPDQHLKKHLAGPAKCFSFALRLLDLEDEPPHLFGKIILSRGILVNFDSCDQRF